MNNNKFSSIPDLIENGVTVKNSKDKSNVLNEYFTSKATVSQPNDDVPLLPKKPNIPNVDCINTSPLEVSKIIRDNLKKSNGSYCGIPGKFLGLIATPISFSMSRLFNNLFEIGHYPELWKMSHVTAIYKFKGSKSDKVNYRPISLLPTLSKICESVIHHRLLSHCLENNIISTRQAAYIKGDSTVNQLLYIVNKIRQSWGKKMCTQGVFLDVSSAFEKVWHKGLIAKLNQIGIEGKLLKLFESYLSNRRQIVVVDGVKSTETNICAGVPQGSRLGPILFIIYINDIVENLKSEILIFADDCSLMVSAEDPSQSTKILNDDLETISKWASTWKITFNPNKSQDKIFSN